MNIRIQQHKKPARNLISLFPIVIGMLIAWVPALAAGTNINALLFYSPSCGHCQKVITEVLPPIQEKYGEQLVILGVDVTYAEGQDLYQAAIQHFQIPAERVGVPTLIVGDTILVGSAEIPEEFEQIIEQGLQDGGIGWPEIPGLAEQIAALELTADRADSSTIQADQAANIGNASVSQEREIGDNTNPQPVWMQKFLRDPLANSIAVLLLIIMIIGAIASIVLVIKPLPAGSQPGGSTWQIPVLVLLGVFIAVYMTYIEVTKSDAICGPVGDCNAVQQSPYAYLFGVLPVGIFGLIGYIAIGAAWLLHRIGPASIKSVAGLSMWGMALFGVVFSIYLTFLEPFVIGATCIWCISSAVVITLLLAATTNFARQIDELEDEELDALNEADI